MTPAEILIAFAAGLLAGSFAGVMGVGGGVIMVPVLTELLGFDQHTAQGTSLAVIIATAVVATASARRRGLLDLPLAIRVGLGGLAGAAAGAVLATQVLDDLVLRRVFGVLVLVSAAKAARDVFRSAPQEPPGAGAVPRP